MAYFAYVLTLFMFSEGTGLMSYSPICKAANAYDYIPIKAVNGQLVAEGIMAFIAKEAYKINIFLAMQSFRNKETWWSVFKPLYLGSIFWLGSIYAWHFIICSCWTGWKDPELYALLPESK